MAETQTTLKIALDWTPNTIHSGLFLAQAKGIYSEADLNVELLPPDSDYSQTPAKRLEAREVDLAICPSESVIAYAESNKPNFKLQAIYAILQKDASAIVTTKNQFLHLRDLESGTYGSYNARYEDAIVRAMVDADGGNGSKVKIESSKGKLSLFEELKNGGVDATWIFLPWEGVEAEMASMPLQIFKTEDFGVPYGYSPVIARNAGKNKIDDEILKTFVKATRRGYEMSMAMPETAVEVLKAHCVPSKSEEFLLTSQKNINQSFSDGAELGSMSREKWQRWVAWLKEMKLVMGSDLQLDPLFANL